MSKGLVALIEHQLPSGFETHKKWGRAWIWFKRWSDGTTAPIETFLNTGFTISAPDSVVEGFVCATHALLIGLEWTGPNVLECWYDKLIHQLKSVLPLPGYLIRRSSFLVSRTAGRMMSRVFLDLRPTLGDESTLNHKFWGAGDYMGARGRPGSLPQQKNSRMIIIKRMLGRVFW